MLSARMNSALALMGGGRAVGYGPDRSAAAVLCAAALGVDGVCAGLGVGPGGAVLVWGRDAVAIALEDAQFTLGQGPGPDAVAAGAPVLVPTLAETAGRWPAFASAAAGLNVRAVFAFPLRIGAVSVGVLLAHRRVPGVLALAQVEDALALAEAVTARLLLAQRVPPEAAFSAPGPGPPYPRSPRLPTHRAEMHQATGMISVQLDVSTADALIRLRAYAYANDRSVGDVAADVKAHRLYFDKPKPSEP